jgi:nitrite reductase (NO-forming)
MRRSQIGFALLPVLVLVAAFAVGRDPKIVRVDFDTLTVDSNAPYAAALAPAARGEIKEFRIPIVDATIEVAEGVTYRGWTFGGTVPGPAIRVRQGDRVRVRLVNRASLPHSIDFHAARIPMDRAFRTIVPGDSLEFEFVAADPGAFVVHCGTPPVLLHLMQGMYLPIIVDPRGGWGSTADKEFVIVQSEFYLADGNRAAPGEPDFKAAMDRRATHVVFNGRAFQYQQHPLDVGVGDRVRLFVVNAGPSFASDFHVVGAVFDRVYPDGNPDNVLSSVQTWSVPAGGGAVFEAEFAEHASGTGLYAFVTHAFAEASKGAVGLIRVGGAQRVAGAGH